MERARSLPPANDFRRADVANFFVVVTGALQVAELSFPVREGTCIRALLGRIRDDLHSPSITAIFGAGRRPLLLLGLCNFLVILRMISVFHDLGLPFVTLVILNIFSKKLRSVQNRFNRVVP